MAESIGRNRRPPSGKIMIETPTVTASPGTIMLGAYAARSCPVKTQNAFNPMVTVQAATDGASVESNDGLAELFDGGAQFQAAVLEQLIGSCSGSVVDLRPMSDVTRRIVSCVFRRSLRSASVQSSPHAGTPSPPMVSAQ